MYGLTRQLSFDTSAIPALPGHTRLLNMPIGPEGVLFKRITSMQDALLCGGIMLYDTNHNSWIVYTGETLVKALNHDLLGWCTERDWTISTQAVRFVAIANKEVIKAGYTSPGGEVMMKEAYVEFFNPVENFPVYAVGVVCSTSDGMIVSKYGGKSLGTLNGFHPVISSAPIGYMSTEVPMKETFTGFTRGILDSMLSTIPDDLKQYYISTFENVIATVPFKDAHPTISVCTYWRNGSLWNGAAYGPKQEALNVTSALNGYESGLPNGAISSTPAPGAADRPGIMYHTNLPGAFYSGASLFPDLGEQEAYCDKLKTLTPPVGNIGGLKTGELRNMHVMYRALVDGMSFADEVANFNTLADFVKDSVVQTTVPYSVVYPQAVLEAEVLDQLNAARSRPSYTSTSIFCRGSLPTMLESFSNAWDTAAKNAANPN